MKRALRTELGANPRAAWPRGHLWPRDQVGVSERKTAKRKLWGKGWGGGGRCFWLNWILAGGRPGGSVMEFDQIFRVIRGWGSFSTDLTRFLLQLGCAGPTRTTEVEASMVRRT